VGHGCSERPRQASGGYGMGGRRSKQHDGECRCSGTDKAGPLQARPLRAQQRRACHADMFPAEYFCEGGRENGPRKTCIPTQINIDARSRAPSPSRTVQANTSFPLRKVINRQEPVPPGNYTLERNIYGNRETI
jgi:hypothetical protein